MPGMYTYCGTESELVEAVLECIECLTDDSTSMGGRCSGFAVALLMMIDEHRLSI